MFGLLVTVSVVIHRNMRTVKGTPEECQHIAGYLYTMTKDHISITYAHTLKVQEKFHATEHFANQPICCPLKLIGASDLDLLASFLLLIFVFFVSV